MAYGGILACAPKRKGCFQALQRYTKTSVTLSEETIQMLEEKILEYGCKPKQKRTKRPENRWKLGEIYCYDVDPAYADIPELKGYTIGFLCVDLYKYAGMHPVVYVFRTQYSIEEICANPVGVLSGEFWRTCKWDNNLFEYRAILWTDKSGEIPINRFHACGVSIWRRCFLMNLLLEMLAASPQSILNQLRTTCLEQRY